MIVSMAAEDLERERQRLAKLYASMSDGELQQVADDAGSLMEVALLALADEVQRRGLDIDLAESAVPMKDVSQSELVTIRQFRDLPEALLAKGSLESAGIDSYFADDNMVRLDWFISNLIGGIKLKVRKEDEEEASQLLNQPISEDFEVEGSEKYQQPRCPRCGSLDISHEAGLDKRFALPGLALGGIPVPVPRDAWNCGSCGHEWHDAPSSETDTQGKE
jgi:ribosomal protein S27AE